MTLKEKIQAINAGEITPSEYPEYIPTFQACLEHLVAAQKLAPQHQMEDYTFEIENIQSILDQMAAQA